jgi:hypothetical protein
MTSHPNAEIAARLAHIEQAGGHVTEYTIDQGNYWGAECPCGYGHVGLVDETSTYTTTLDDMIEECSSL